MRMERVRRAEPAQRDARRRSMASRVVSTGRGGVDAASRGMRSCSSSSVAFTCESAWKRSTITLSQQGVGGGHQRHALVVRHERADDHAFGPARRRVASLGVSGPSAACSRSTRSTRSAPSAPAAVRRARFCSAACGAIGRASAVAYGAIDEVVGEAALEAEAGHAERPVLVGVVPVADVVRRFGDAPRHAALPAVLRSAGRRRPRWSSRAASPGTTASAATASGTRTSSRSTTAASGTPSTLIARRPRWNQCRCGTSPRAMAMKLASRASEASRS